MSKQQVRIRNHSLVVAVCAGSLFCMFGLVCISCSESSTASIHAQGDQTSSNASSLERWSELAEQTSLSRSGSGTRFVFAVATNADSDRNNSSDQLYYLGTVGASSGSVSIQHSELGALTISEIKTVFTIAARYWTCSWSLLDDSEELEALLTQSGKNARRLSEEEAALISETLQNIKP